MTLVRDELSDEGELSRRFYDLALVGPLAGVRAHLPRDAPD